MMVTKGISVVKLVAWTLPYILWLTLLMGGFAALYHYDYIEFSIPLFSLSIIGTAVAFYMGFKNNQAYDRMWEARKFGEEL